MSWDYSYYICRKDKKDGKLYPFGPFDYKGNFFKVLERSRDFASELHECFYEIYNIEDRQMISEELLEAIYGERSEELFREFYEGNGYYLWSYLPYCELPQGEYFKKGYCLIDQISRFEENKQCFSGFYNWIDSAEYVRRLENEVKLGKPKSFKDEDGIRHTPNSMRDYSFYRWIDYESPEYEAYIIRRTLEIMRYTFELEQNDEEIVVVLKQG